MDSNYENSSSNKNIEQKVFTVKVKTLDNNTCEFDVDQDTTISALKSLIISKLNVPYNKQRLLLQGKLVLNNETMSQLKVKRNSVFHLVALPAIINQQIEDTISNSSQHEINLQCQHMFGDILRSMRHNTNQVKTNHNYRRKDGIFVTSKNRLEIIQQSLQQINQLFQSQIDTKQFFQNQNMNIFSMQNFKYLEGQWVDFKDIQGQWQEGQIIHIIGNQALVQIIKGRKTELIELNSKRISPFRSHTIDSTVKPYFSPSTNIFSHNKKNDLEDLLRQMYVSLDQMKINLGQLQEQIKIQNIDKSNIILEPKSTENQDYNYKDIQAQISELIKDPQIETQSETKSDKDNNDTNSIQSLKSKDNLDLYDNCSIKSFRSHLSNWSYYQKLADIDNNITEEEEDSNQSNISNENKQFNEQEVNFIRLAAQTAPLMDRLGRAMIDMSPVLAQIGQSLQKLVTNQNAQLSINTSLQTNQGSCNKTDDKYYFQVPLLPNPIELLNFNADLNLMENEDQKFDVHLHNFNNSLSNVSNQYQNQQHKSYKNQYTQTKNEKQRKEKKVSFIVDQQISKNQNQFNEKRQFFYIRTQYEKLYQNNMLKKNNFAQKISDEVYIIENEIQLKQKQDEFDAKSSLSDQSSIYKQQGLVYEKKPLVLDENIFIKKEKVIDNFLENQLDQDNFNKDKSL